MFTVRSYRVGICGFLAALLLMSQSANAQSVQHDLRYIADKPLVAIWSHPNAHLANPVLAELVKLVQEMAPPEATAMSSGALLKLDLMRLSLSMGRSPYSDKPVPRVVSIYHFTDPAAAVILLNNMSKGLAGKTIPEIASPIYSRTPAGQTEEAWKLNMGFTQLNPQTVVQAESIEKMIEVLKPATAAAPAWASDLTALSKTQSTMFIDLVQIRDQLKQAGPSPGQGGMEGMIFNSVKPLWEQADYACINLDTTNGIQLSAQATSPTAESAQRFKGSLEGILGLAKGFLPTAKQATQQLNLMTPGLGDMAYTELENLVNSIKITQDGMQTKLTLGISQETLAKVPALLLPAIKSAREQAMRVQGMNNLRQIGLAMHNYLDANKTFPPAVVLGKDGKTPHSWRVAILPYLEEQALYDQYKFDEPWDSENNKKVAATIPAVYRSAVATNRPNCTSYVVLTSPDGVFNATPAANGTKPLQVRDGLSNTLMVVEANAEIPWTKPEDLPIVDGQPLPKLGTPGATTFNAAFCDGAVHTLSTAIKDELLRNLINMKDGNVIDRNELDPQPAFPPGTAPVKPMPPGPAPARPIPAPVP